MKGGGPGLDRFAPMNFLEEARFTGWDVGGQAGPPASSAQRARNTASTMALMRGGLATWVRGRVPHVMDYHG